MNYVRSWSYYRPRSCRTLFILRPTTGQVRHKAFFKVGPDAGLQPTRVRQNPKIPSAPSAFPQWGRLRRQETKQQTIGKTISLRNTMSFIPPWYWKSRGMSHYTTLLIYPRLLKSYCHEIISIKYHIKKTSKHQVIHNISVWIWKISGIQ